jgi:hydrogenase maturation protease
MSGRARGRQSGSLLGRSSGPPRGTVRILACGSVDGGDDAAGLEAVRLLPDAIRQRASIDEVGQLSADHLIGDAPDVVRLVVDCVVGPPPGTVLELPLAELPALERTIRSASSHLLPLGQAVALADRLGAVRPGDRFVGIGGEFFALGAAKSPAVAAGLPELTKRIAALVG